jgi:hypothetical protein
VLKDSKVLKELRDSKVLRELRDSKVLRVLKDSKVLRELRDSKVLRVLRDFKVLRALRDFKVLRELRDSKALKDFKVLVLLVHKAQPDLVFVNLLNALIMIFMPHYLKLLAQPLEYLLLSILIPFVISPIMVYSLPMHLVKLLSMLLKH